MHSGRPVSVPITVDGGADDCAARPLTFGIPFPPGALVDPSSLRLRVSGCDGALPLQVRVTAAWPDGSIRWLLIDSVLPALRTDAPQLCLESELGGSTARSSAMTVESDGGRIRVATGAALFALPAAGPRFDDLEVDGPSGRASVRFEFLDRAGERREAVVNRCDVEEVGPVRTTIAVRGGFRGTAFRFTARFCFFAEQAWMRVRATIENPRRARHRRGSWDLGDRGSLVFRDFSVAVSWPADAAAIHGGAVTGEGVRRCARSWTLHQASSGGENWRSPNHRDARGILPLPFRGFRLRADDAEHSGARAEPIAGVSFARFGIAVAAEDFWQNFPKALEIDRRSLRLRLFPRQSAPFELQGGEHKTHTFWLDFGAEWRDGAAPLRWAHAPTSARAPAEWYAVAGAAPLLTAAEVRPVFADILRRAARGDTSLAARREIIDEYGWRNYGDLFADHEGRFYQGPAPVISHYNNQYDVIYGALLQYLWSGDTAWRDVALPLARHVVDIDLYNTTEDRPAYSGGLFWHTEHYRDAATATQRSYSAANRPSRFASHGGGPSAENNYTSGLLFLYYLTGEPRAAEAVRQLADWVIAMDDGARNILGLIDDGRTGWATRTVDSHYHGPGRGAGNSLDAVLDAWLLTGERAYLDKADEIIQRVVHPSDDIERNELRDIERRWSYLIFLRTLARYLELKGGCDQVDDRYAYARSSLLHYAGWMRANETPYLERREQLEYPTEAWPALDLVKANVMRAAAAHAGAAAARELAAAADAIADRGYRDLAAFETRDSVRAISHLAREALADACWRRDGIVPRPAPAMQVTPPPHPRFETQRERVRQLLLQPTAWPRIGLRLLRPSTWRRVRFARP